MILNFIDKIDEQLSNETKSVLDICSKCADKTGFKIYLVGGIVRDLYLKRKCFDIDITVEGDAISFCHKLAEANDCKIVQVQENLRTAKVIFANGTEIDFASTRQEFYPRKGHLPVVARTGCSLEEDVYRRDFTLNALAISLNKTNYGEVIDYVGGIKDLENNELRVLHSNSFIEDPSRIIRGLKFASRFGFRREEQTRQLQDEYLESQLNRDISWTRVKAELKQTFSLNMPVVYDKFLGTNIQRLLYAQKPNLTGLEIQNLIDTHDIENPWLVYLATVLFDKELIEAFCFTRQEKKIFQDVDFLMNNNLSMLNNNYDVYKFFEKRTLESVVVYYLLTKRKEPLLYLEKLSKIKVLLTGDDLKELGMQDGKEIGVMLDEILKKKLSQSIVNKEDEINFVKSKIK